MAGSESSGRDPARGGEPPAPAATSGERRWSEITKAVRAEDLAAAAARDRLAKAGAASPAPRGSSASSPPGASAAAKREAAHFPVVAAHARWHPSPWLLAGVGAGAVLLLVLLIVFRSSREAAPAGTGAAVATPSGPSIVTDLRDRAGRIALLDDGSVRGLDGVAPNVLTAVASALATGHLPESPELAGLQRSQTPDPALVPGPRLLAPVGVRVLTEQPLFRWQEAPEFATVQVGILDASGVELQSSPRLTGGEWRPTRALPRSRPLVWRLTARPRRSNETPVVRLASFAVAPPDEIAWLEREIEAAHHARLVAAVLYAQVGALDDASPALDELARRNPGANLATRLRADLERRHPR